MKIEDCWASFAAAVIDRAIQDRKEEKQNCREILITIRPKRR